MNPAQVDGFNRQRFIFGTPEPTPQESEPLRLALGSIADPIAALIAAASNTPTDEKLERLVYQLRGAITLVMQLRAANADEARQDG